MLTLSLFLTISSLSTSAAGLEDLGKEVDGSILTNEESAEGIWQNVARGSLLDQGIAKLQILEIVRSMFMVQLLLINL